VQLEKKLEEEARWGMLVSSIPFLLALFECQCYSPEMEEENDTTL
jgi:hypothetical protein